MIPPITILPYDCTPIGIPKRKSASLSDTVPDPARDMNNGEVMALNSKYDVSQIDPPPIVVAPITPGEWDKYTLENDKKYIDIFRNMALGTEKDSRYKYVFADKTIQLFGDKSDQDAIVKQLDAMIEEIKNNFATGVKDPTANLKTKFTISGVEFSYDEMITAREKMQYAHDLVGGNGTKDYMAYADIGIGIGYIKNYGKGIDSQQASLLNKKIAERAEQVISFAEQYSEGKEPNPNEEDRKFYAYKHSSNATNREYTGALVKLFAELDFSDSAAVETAFSRYEKLLGDTKTANRTDAEQFLINQGIAQSKENRRERLEGKFEFKHYTLTTLKKEIDKVNAMRKASARTYSTNTGDAARPKSPSEIIAEHAKEAYKNDTSANSPASHYAAFNNTVLNTYNFIAEQHKNFGDWAKYYRDSMQEDSDIKKRAASYTDHAAEMFRENHTLNSLASASLTAEDEALAYRTYGDAFLTQKAKYFDQAQRDTEEYGYMMGRQYAMVAKMLDRQIQMEYGTDDMEMFKLEFHRESFLNSTSNKGFMEQLLLAIESIEKQLEALEEHGTTVEE